VAVAARVASRTLPAKGGDEVEMAAARARARAVAARIRAAEPE